jgi:ribosomal protein L19
MEAAMLTRANDETVLQYGAKVRVGNFKGYVIRKSEKFFATHECKMTHKISAAGGKRHWIEIQEEVKNIPNCNIHYTELLLSTTPESEKQS